MNIATTYFGIVSVDICTYMSKKSLGACFGRSKDDVGVDFCANLKCILTCNFFTDPVTDDGRNKYDKD